jgi:aryl-alcohol dehydrogenase-like predicted oxidoreductase
VAKTRGIGPFELALGYVKRHRYLGTAIIGATTVAQLVANIAAVRVERDSATLAAIADILWRYPNPAR